MEERAGPEEIPEEETRRTPLWLELPGLLFTALAVAVVVKTFLIQPFYIPSESMLPTIEINDRVIVNKLAYRFGEPEPGDVVVVLNPALTDEQLQESIPEAVIRSILEAVGVRSRPEVDLIKRVVAVEGQTVEVADGRLYIDGVPQEEPYLLEPDIRGTFGPQVVPRATCSDGRQPQLQPRLPRIRSGARRRDHRPGDLHLAPGPVRHSLTDCHYRLLILTERIHGRRPRTLRNRIGTGHIQGVQRRTPLFPYVVETERRFYLANAVEVKRHTEGDALYFEVVMEDAWVGTCSAPPASSTRSGSSPSTINIEELSRPEDE